MLHNSEDIKNIQFDRARKGYDPEGVDQFVDEVAELVESMERERSELERKMMLLAEKVEEYQRNGGGASGDAILNEARQRAEAIVRDASIKAERIAASASMHAAPVSDEGSLIRMKKEAAKFKNDLLSLYKKHLEQISQIPDYNETSAPAPVRPADNYGYSQAEPYSSPVERPKQPAYSEPAAPSWPPTGDGGWGASPAPSAPAENVPSWGAPAPAAPAADDSFSAGFSGVFNEIKHRDSNAAPSYEPDISGFGEEKPRKSSLDFGDDFNFNI